MALQDWEGFDQEDQQQYPGWFATANFSTITPAGEGVYGLGRACAAQNLARTLIGGNQTAWWQFHLKPYRTGVDNFLNLYQGGSYLQFRLAKSATDKLEIYRGTSLLATSAETMGINVWHYIQIRLHIHGSSGNIQLWVNGVQWLNFNGNTQATGYPDVDKWEMVGHTFDNWMVYTEAGAEPNAQTPELLIYTHLPTGAGDVTGFVPSAGANFQCVDEQPSDGDTSYVAAASPADDLYSMPASNVGLVVYGVACEYDARKDDAGTNSVDPILKTAGTIYPAGSPAALSGSYQRLRALWPINPATGLAWTRAQAIGAQMGIRRTL